MERMQMLVYGVVLLLIYINHTVAFVATTLRPAVTTKVAPLSGSVKIIVPEGVPADEVMRRFKRAVNQAGILHELKYRSQWENAIDKRKRKLTNYRMQRRYERMNDLYERRALGIDEYDR